jgi:hypothetical protein
MEYNKEHEDQIKRIEGLISEYIAGHKGHLRLLARDIIYEFSIYYRKGFADGFMHMSRSNGLSSTYSKRRSALQKAMGIMPDIEDREDRNEYE